MEIESIQPRTGRKHGGTRCNKIEIVEARGVQSLPEVINSFYIGQVVLNAGYDWLEINGARNSIQFNEDRVIENGAELYAGQVKIQWSGDEGALMNRMQKMARLGILIKITNRSGNTFIVGTKDQPTRFNYGKDNKAQMIETNRLEGVYRYKNNRPAIAYAY